MLAVFLALKNFLEDLIGHHVLVLLDNMAESSACAGADRTREQTCCPGTMVISSKEALAPVL